MVGMAAAVLTTVSLLPQLLKAWKTKSTKDISLKMFLIFTVGVVAWLAYGLLLDSLPIIVANVFTLALALGILYCKFKYG
ncbi:MAG: hypothetical protein GY852_00605 [bacterium]|nr:hypothetical protein [bacterium]